MTWKEQPSYALAVTLMNNESPLERALLLIDISNLIINY